MTIIGAVPLSFESLYRRFAGDVFRFALSMCRDRADAEDVTAETFVRAWAGVDETRATTIKAYLFTIARNLVHKRLSAGRRRGELDLETAAGHPRLDERLNADAELRRVFTAMDALPERMREALILRVDQDLSYEEIAVLLGISVASAKVLVHRARHKLAASREPSAIARKAGT
jgi:RNA polymerase sigma-70 factor (ECF subfamily)